MGSERNGVRPRQQAIVLPPAAPRREPAPESQRRRRHGEQARGAAGGALVGSQCFPAALADLLAAGGVGEQAVQFRTKRGGVFDLNRRPVREQVGGERREVFHMRAEQDRLAEDRRLRGILPPAGRKAFADEDERREVIPIAEFAGRIDQEHVARLGRGDRQRRAADDAQIEGRKLAEDFGNALDMPRRYDEDQLRMRPAQFEESGGEDLFFSREGASGDEDRGGRADAQWDDERTKFFGAGIVPLRRSRI